MLSEKDLKSLGEEGFLAGPDETEESFVKRFNILKNSPFERIDPKPLERRNCKCHELYAANPDWIPLTFSNKGLLPWEGGALWIFENHLPLIQLRKGFKKGKFLIYSKDEVLKHETVHALRLAFNEPRFEEILAYETSSSKWRRWIGPLFRKPSHAAFFISLVLISLTIQTVYVFFIPSPLFSWIKGASFLPFVDLIFRSALLIKDRKAFRMTLRKLGKIFPNQKNVFPIAVRLKDSEIQSFALLPLEKVVSYFEEKASKSIRIRQILAQFC